MASSRVEPDTFGAAAALERMVFFSGLPGVGKSLFIRELARVAHALGRNVHLLQWDVVRPAFESRAILARYPERDGATHPVLREFTRASAAAGPTSNVGA